MRIPVLMPVLALRSLQAGPIAAFAPAGLPQARAASILPSVELPPELDRVLRDYDRHWRGAEVDALVDLFTDGFAARRGGWIRGREALREGLEGTSSDLRLRPVAYAADGDVGYIVGNYRYGEEPEPPA